jgi:uncharacterized protein YqgC (DUF456 family)
MEIYFIWALTLTLILIGLAGVVVPLLPGTSLIMVAIVLHKLLLPADVSWTVLAWIGGFWVLSVVVDFAGVMVGTRLFGGGKLGMLGAGGGAVLGMFFSLPMLLLGTVLGALAAEKLIAQKSNRSSLLAGAGAAFGFLISTAGRLACAVVMIGLFLVASWNAWATSRPEPVF